MDASSLFRVIKVLFFNFDKLPSIVHNRCRRTLLLTFGERAFSLLEWLMDVGGHKFGEENVIIEANVCHKLFLADIIIIIGISINKFKL